MLHIGNTLLSLDVVEKCFTCDLENCKGACCVEGDSGAPLTIEEVAILDEIFPLIKPFMSPQGIGVVKAVGTSETDYEGDQVTPCIDNRDCVYAINENGITLCAIEKAYLQGVVEFRKPLSCHLYPLRVTPYKHYQAINYDVQDICKAGRIHGQNTKKRLFEFLKEPLERAYGKEWYKELYRTGRLYLKEREE